MTESIKHYLTYDEIKKAEYKTPQNNIFRFIESRKVPYSKYLDKDHAKKLQTNDFHSRYWELLSCCLLVEKCKVELKKPIFKKDTSNYDLDVSVNNFTFALENVVIKNADKSSEEIPNDLIWNPHEEEKAKSFKSYPLKIQIRISNALINKKKQYNALIRDGNIKTNVPYVLAIGLYGLPFASSQVNSFLSLPTSYLGCVFPVGFPLFHINKEKDINLAQQENSNATYQLNNTKNNGAPISKAIFTDPTYSFISAILISGRCDQSIMMRDDNELYNDFILIHNPLAINKLPIQLFPVQSEHIADINSDRITIKKI